MKTLIIVATLVVLGVVGNAQWSRQGFGMPEGRKETPDETKRRLDKAAQAAAGTNLIRVVQGKTYQVIHSTNWVTLPRPYESDLGSQRLKVYLIDRGLVICEVETYHSDFGTQMSGYLAITNWPNLGTAVTGEYVKPIRAMRAGRFNWGGEMLPVFDHGTPQRGLPR